MSQLLRLSLPIGIGLFAAWLNWVTVNAKIAPRCFVAVNREIEEGQTIKLEDLSPIEIGGDVASLSKTAIGWEERGILVDSVARRELKSGDLCLFRDLGSRKVEAASDEMAITVPVRQTLPNLVFAGDKLGFLVGSASSPTPLDIAGSAPSPSSETLQYIGPFRVLAVGTDLVTEGDVAERRSGVSNLITLGLHRKAGTGNELDDASTRLLLALKEERGERVVAVELVAE